MTGLDDSGMGKRNSRQSITTRPKSNRLGGTAEEGVWDGAREGVRGGMISCQHKTYL